MEIKKTVYLWGDIYNCRLDRYIVYVFMLFFLVEHFNLKGESIMKMENMIGDVSTKYEIEDGVLRKVAVFYKPQAKKNVIEEVASGLEERMSAVDEYNSNYGFCNVDYL